MEDIFIFTRRRFYTFAQMKILGVILDSLLSFILYFQNTISLHGTDLRKVYKYIRNHIYMYILSKMVLCLEVILSDARSLLLFLYPGITLGYVQVTICGTAYLIHVPLAR